ncbi:MAG: DUF6801 domain-containing protein [Streptosporangiaceae bacterium]
MTRHVARAVTGIAAVGLTVAAAAVAAAATAGPPATQQHASAQVTYTCPQSSGSLSVPVTVAATVPVRMTSGQPVRPAAAQLTIHLPPALVSSLAAGHAATLDGTARLSVAVAQGKSQATASWAGLSGPSATLPASGGLTLTASGPVPAVQPRATGPLTFTVAGLSLMLTPHAPAGTGTNSPGQQPVTLACTPAGGQKLILATVAAAPAGQHRHKAKTAARHKAFCPKQPKGGYKLNPRFKPPKVPKGVKIHRPPPSIGCADAAGYADVRKLHGASRLGPAVVAVTVGIKVDYNFSRSNYFQQDSAGELDYRSCTHHKCTIKHGLPPTQATFLAFGFVPATATMHLDEIGTLDIFSVGTISALKVNYSNAAMRLTISNVKVNGVPLNVGANCQAVRPLIIKLTGRAPGYSLQNGGPLAGSVNISAFKGCGVGENLDPLFGTMRHGVLVGSISGPGNFSILTQGNLCTPVSDSGCPPRLPRPIH